MPIALCGHFGGISRCRSREKEGEGTSTCSLKFQLLFEDGCDAALVGQGRGLLDPPLPSSFSVLVFASLLARPLICLETIQSARCPRVCTRRAAPPATSRGRPALDGSKAGVALGRDGTTPQRPFRPCRIQSRYPMSARRRPCTRSRTTHSRRQSRPSAALPKCAESTKYRKQRKMRLTRRGPRFGARTPRKMRGASTTKSETRQLWPRQTTQVPLRTLLERPQRSRSTLRR